MRKIRIFEVGLNDYWVIIRILTFALSIKQNKFGIIHLVRTQNFPKN